MNAGIMLLIGQRDILSAAYGRIIFVNWFKAAEPL